MRIDTDLAAFMESPVMIIVGSADADLQPQIARAIGAAVDAEKGLAELILSGWQWPDTIDNVRLNNRVAVTFARPSDYVSYQVTGRATVGAANGEHRACAQRYIDAMTATLVGQGVEHAVTLPWLVDRDPLVLHLAIEAIFVQTPGDKAGQPHVPPR